LGTADLFITISDDYRPLLRVDLYGDSSQFQDALVWHDHVFVGFGNQVYVVDPKQQSVSEIFLGPTLGYFGAFYTGQDYLLVADVMPLAELLSH
jgi:hypothetical protein